MPMNLPSLPVTIPFPLDENKITPPLPPSSSSSPPPPPPPDLPLMARDQSAAATKIHDQLLRRSLSSASGDTVVIVEEEEDEEERRAKEELKLKEEWIKKMRGWLMVLATLAASVTYAAGLNPPGGFWQDDLKPSTNRNIQPHTAGNPVLADKSPTRYKIFVACNNSAFATSIAIIVLLLHESIFHTEVRLALLKCCVVGDMFTLMMAFGAGSTRRPADIAGIVVSSLWTFSYLIFRVWRIKKKPAVWTFSYLIFRVWRIKKKPAARRSSSSQESDVELGAIGQQTSQDR